LNRLTYLIRIAHVLRPSTASDRYEEIVSQLVQAPSGEFIDSLGRGDVPGEPIVLSIRDVVYFDLTFSIADRPLEEKRKLISAYRLVIRQAAQLLAALVAFDPTLTKLSVSTHLGHFISYTQFWETQHWEEVSEEINDLRNLHLRELVKFAYTIMHSVIVNETDPERGFQLCERLFDLFGFISLNDLIGAHFDEAVHHSGFHEIRFEETYFPTLFLFLEYLSNGREAFESYLSKLMHIEKTVFDETAVLQTILHKFPDVKNEEIRAFRIADHPNLDADRTAFVKIVEAKLDEQKKRETAALESMDVSDERWGEITTEIKNEMVFDDLDAERVENPDRRSMRFVVPLPKRALVDIPGFHLMRGFSYSELVDRVLVDTIAKNTQVEQRARDLGDVSEDFGYLLLPTDYFSRLGSSFSLNRFPAQKDRYYDEITAGSRAFSVRWIPHLKKIFAFNGTQGNFGLFVDEIQFSIGETKTRSNQTITDIVIEVPFGVSSTFRYQTYHID
jgi:hypothetical protein